MTVSCVLFGEKSLASAINYTQNRPDHSLVTILTALYCYVTYFIVAAPAIHFLLSQAHKFLPLFTLLHHLLSELETELIYPKQQYPQIQLPYVTARSLLQFILVTLASRIFFIFGRFM